MNVHVAMNVYMSAHETYTCSVCVCVSVFERALVCRESKGMQKEGNEIVCSEKRGFKFGKIIQVMDANSGFFLKKKKNKKKKKKKKSVCVRG